MATLKLKPNKTDPASAEPRQRRDPAGAERAPVRGTGSGVRARPTLAQAQALRDEREQRYQEQLRQRFGDQPPPDSIRRPRDEAARPPRPTRDPRERRDTGEPRGDSRGESRGRPGGGPGGNPRSDSRAAPYGAPRGDSRSDPRGAPRGGPQGERRGPQEQRGERRGPHEQRGEQREQRPPRPGAGPARAAGPATGPELRRGRDAGAPPERRPSAGSSARRPVPTWDSPQGSTNSAFGAPPPRRPPAAQPPAAVAQRSAPTRDAAGTLRLSKYMGELGIASRREADEWIAKGWVRVDGRVVSELGSRVVPGQHVTVDAKARFVQAQKVTVLINKPVGYVSGQAEDGYEPAYVLVKPDNQWSEDHSGIRFLPQHLRSLVPAGRLDIDSVGLLVLTQDGRIAKQLIGENSPIEKEYLVRVAVAADGGLSDEGLALLRHGLELDGEALREARVEWVNEDQLRFVLQEGKKRQIRRMCEAVGLQVLGLKRVRIGRIMLGDLPTGQWRYLRVDEGFA